MPTPEEKVAQIEAALRRRFFAYVPKVILPERANWPEEQHDTDRLSRSLAAYTLVSLAEIDDQAAAAAITDGKDDGGIDAMYFSRDQQRLYLVQAKFKRGGAAPAQDENLKTINGIKALVARRFDGFNPHFQGRIDEIEEAFDTPGVLISVGLVFLGEAIGPHVTNDLNALVAEFNAFSERMSWDWYGASRVHEWLLEQERPASVTRTLTIENWGFVAGPRKAVYGQVHAAELANLVSDCGKALFERNIRHYLGSVGVNRAIAETARKTPTELFYLNNGITAVAESITQAAGTTASCVFKLSNFSIVNGAQTAGSISMAAMREPLSEEAKILITVIEIGSSGDAIGNKITRARNHQTAVRGVDFAALDPNQERLRQELSLVGISYHYRPSAESRTHRDDAFTLEEAAVALACMGFPVLTSGEVDRNRVQRKNVKHAIEMAVACKKEVGRLWDQASDLYAAIFPANLSAIRMCRTVRLYRIIDQVLSDTEASESTYNRRMFFRHARHFVMAFIAARSSDLLGRQVVRIDVNDRRTLSERLNRIAEAIYAEAASFQGTKGYLAIFRNLTDSQPLADRVVGRLRAEDEAAARAAREAAPPQGGS